MAEHEQQNLALSAWEAGSLRLTVFTSVPVEASKHAWWADLVGQLPEREVTHPRQASYAEEGPLTLSETVKGKLVLRVQPVRVDWMLVPMDGETEELERIPTLGSFSEAAREFTELMHPWLSRTDIPDLNRMAFGAVLVQHVPDRETGYRKMAEFLKQSVNVDVESSDLTYTINRPRPSGCGIGDMQVNRLSKWLVAARRRITAMQTPKEIKPVSIGATYFDLCLDLDINSSAEFQSVIPVDKREALLREFVHLAEEIASKGDIK
ncbi:MAG TPA: hypothetical protein VM141_11020 [Planctomycetota bacterium]|nr:hypothetical protein [Planctomycetota bacterium]